MLELAAGTGLWTERLAPQARAVHCLDASPEVLERNRARVGDDPRVTYEVADIFARRPEPAWDTIFMGFWLSHVPAALLETFWAGLAGSLRPRGRVLLVDSLADREGTARDQSIDAGGETERRLNDGRSFRIVKVFHDVDRLGDQLRAWGWTPDLHATARWFLYGAAAR